MKHIILVIALFLTNNITFSQITDSINLQLPLKNIRLVSTFGELRKNHFHSGLDFSGFHQIGIPVLAADSGYVSRISISPDGYGNALYITHANGLKTVYGHLYKFAPNIQKYAEQKQYQLQKFNITIYPLPNELPVKKGQIIGYIGNSGRSYAPHLHFEVRNTFLDYPLNPLRFYNIQDSKPPIILRVAIYPASDSSFIQNQHSEFIFRATKTYNISVAGPIYFGIETYDLTDYHYSYKGIYSVKLFINDTLFLWYKFDRILFQNTRYINAFMDYKNYLKQKIKIQKSYITPNNSLCIYKYTTNNGIFIPKKGKYKITYLVSDYNGNSSSYTFYITLQNNPHKHIKPKGKLLNWNENFLFDTLNLHLEIPEKALFDTTYFSFKILHPSDINALSPIYIIHSPYTPLFKPIKIKITVSTYINPDKLIIAYINHANQIYPLYTKYSLKQTDPLIMTNIYEPQKIVLTAQSYNFGKFFVTFDTTKPSITPITPKVRQFGNYIKFKINDNFAGIKDYKVLVNKNWTLFSYDAKTKTIKTIIDTVHFKRDTNHIEIIVTDYCNNQNIYKQNIIIK